MSALRDAAASARKLGIDAALVFVLAFFLRLWVARHLAGESVWDGHYYDFYAHRIARGFGYSDPWVVGGVDVGRPSCHYPVGYSAALGAFYWLFGHARSTSVFFNALVGGGLASAIALWGHASLGRVRGTIAGVLVALHPGLVLFSALTMSETLSALGTALAFVASSRLREHPRVWVRIAVPSLLVGLSAIVRPPALFVLPFVLPWRVFPWSLAAFTQPVRPLLRAAGLLALSGAIAMLPILPWTARNCARMDGCALVSTNGGWNLAIGAFPRATGRFESLRAEDGCREVTGQVQQDRCWLGVGIGHIRSAPLRWLSLVPKKWAHTFDHESFQVEYLHESNPSDWPEPKRAQSRSLLTALHWGLCFLAAASSLRRMPLRELRPRSARPLLLGLTLLVPTMIYGLKQAPETIWPILLVGGVVAVIRGLYDRGLSVAEIQAWGLVGSVFLTHAIFFGEDRYHIVATPALCLLAAAIFQRPHATHTKGEEPA